MSSLNSETINILITSAGKNYALVNTFQEAAQTLGLYAKVYTCDMEPDKTTANFVSDGSFTVPRITSEDYMQDLQSICLGNNVTVVIPTAEKELPIMSANKDIFAKIGITILTPDYDFVMKCKDSHQFDGYLEKLGIDIDVSQQMGNYKTLVDTCFTKDDFAERVLKKYLLNGKKGYLDA